MAWAVSKAIYFYCGLFLALPYYYFGKYLANKYSGKSKWTRYLLVLFFSSFFSIIFAENTGGLKRETIEESNWANEATREDKNANIFLMLFITFIPGSAGVFRGFREKNNFLCLRCAFPIKRDQKLCEKCLKTEIVLHLAFDKKENKKEV